MKDTLGRGLEELRVSVTDRCNFRCTYCMPREVYGEDFPFLPKGDILSFEEIVQLVAAFVSLGVRKVRLTGGEPLLRRDLPLLIAMLKERFPSTELTLTTNGSTLVTHAAALKQAGLDRLTVSLDALDDAVFRRMNDVDFPVHRVLRGIDAALEQGFSPVKVNAVIKRGVNEHQVLPLVSKFRGRQHILRFIEYMDVGHTNGWKMDEVVTAAELHQIISAEYALLPLQPNYAGEVAERYTFADGSGGELGFIASVTRPFCQGCTRARVAADGQLYTCLFATKGHDLRSLLRSDVRDERLREAIAQVWQSRADKYSEERSADTPKLVKMEMSRLGG